MSDATSNLFVFLDVPLRRDLVGEVMQFGKFDIQVQDRPDGEWELYVDNLDIVEVKAFAAQLSESGMAALWPHYRVVTAETGEVVTKWYS